MSFAFKMTTINLNSCFMIASFVLLLNNFCDAGYVQSEGAPLKCHVCDPATCSAYDPKKTKPKVCTVNELNRDSLGPSKLVDYSQIEFQEKHMKVPLFACQKIEATDLQGNYVLRRCQLRLPGNESCTSFYNNLEADPNKLDRASTMNGSCYLCETDGCNNGSFFAVWLPLLLISSIVCFFMK